MALLDGTPDLAEEPEGTDASEPPVRDLASGYSIEVLPFQVDKALHRFERERRPFDVYIPYLPGSDYADVIAAVRAVSAAGHSPVPHLTARSLKDGADLNARLEKLSDAGATDLLLIAGDQDTPAGDFADVRAVLETGAVADHGFCRFAIGGHPDGHPRVRPEVLRQHMADKLALAKEMDVNLRIVTQFSLTPDSVVAWIKGLREADVNVPIHVGLPGPVSFKTLMKFAVQLGVATSARAAFRKPSLLKALTQRWTPGESLVRIAQAFPDDVRTGTIGTHIFAFGGIDASIDWLSQVERGAFSVDGYGDQASLIIA